MSLGDAELIGTIRNLERQIGEHLGSVAHQRWSSLARMYRGVYQRNREELLTLLTEPERNLSLAIELIQNVHYPSEREAYTNDLCRLFLNYVAGVFSLVDHVRRLLADYKAANFLVEFHARRDRMLADSPHAIIQGLRYFCIHVDIPAFAWTFSIEDADQSESFKHHLSVETLLTWDGWTASARTGLEGQTEVDLTDLVRTHGHAIDELHEWLFSQFRVVHGADLDAVNELITRLHSAFARLDAFRQGDPQHGLGVSGHQVVGRRLMGGCPPRAPWGRARL